MSSMNITPALDQHKQKYCNKIQNMTVEWWEYYQQWSDNDYFRYIETMVIISDVTTCQHWQATINQWSDNLEKMIRLWLTNRLT